MKCVTDAMLGRLTRWLRMLGCNVKYVKDLDDESVIRIANKEKRVLLTRDLQLYQRSRRLNVDVFIVEGKSEAERLAALSKRFDIKLELNPDVSRCPKCNARIERARKDKIANQIPLATKAFYEEFWECPKCGKIYWKGAHWKRITETLKEARKILGD